jgi:hypothetical protein
LFVGTSNLIANSAGLFVANATGVVNAAVHQVGTLFTANSTLVNAAAINITGQINTATMFVTTSANIASSNVIANTAGVFVANATGIVNASSFTVGTNTIANSAGFFVANVTGVVSVVNTSGNSILTATTLKVANATSNLFWVNTTVVAFGNNVGIFANGGLGTANQVLTSNGSAVYWANTGAGSGGGGFTNGQSIMVSNLAYSNTANTARAYTFYNSNNNTLDTVFI